MLASACMLPDFTPADAPLRHNKCFTTYEPPLTHCCSCGRPAREVQVLWAAAGPSAVAPSSLMKICAALQKPDTTASRVCVLPPLDARGPRLSAAD